MKQSSKAKAKLNCLFPIKASSKINTLFVQYSYIIEPHMKKKMKNYLFESLQIILCYVPFHKTIRHPC